MKSFADAHGEIKGFAIGEIFCLSAKCEIKSVPLPDEVGFHHEVISSTAGGFIPDERTDLAEKRPCLSTRSFFLVGAGGFEPPKSKKTDLQSAPFGHSGTLPYLILLKNRLVGAGGRTRTPDLLITNQLLYQLSYTSIFKRLTNIP